MTARDEGVIKFKCDWEKTLPLSENGIQDLIDYRQKLFLDKLIGVYPDGIGYGNLSIRTIAAQFVISGSQTGAIAKVNAGHFALVTDYSIAKNQVSCRGPIQASSESLTHAMIYETFPDAAAVIHVHSAPLWNRLKNKVPTTGVEIAYGTPQMAHEIKRLAEQDLKEKGILVMAGHEDGVITFGENLDAAYQILMRYVRVKA